ncbi:hypothetical protein ACIBQ2_07050 [Micromonospora sediminimaris]|uniref:tRNA synthetase class II core domain (G, H, P, S and T) n=1 Tax=Micromonospora sediminimaris TaxID=547162 RepID=A0A9W5XN29_9ACTN|nr:hypothetical protein [Micromonospora sediminimaris]GIJ35898.1 hypothetical protein Vse01_50460 [Micromonospora sediminimaris]
MSAPIVTPAPRVWQADVRLTPDGRRCFDDLLPYCLDEAWSWECDHADQLTVVYHVDDNAAEKIGQRLTEALERARVVPDRQARIVYDSWSADVAPVTGAEGRPDRVAVGPGLAVHGPGPARLVRALDGLFLRLARGWGADEYLVPHLVAWETIERAGYARTFPQHLTTCAVVASDLPALDRFARARTAADRRAELREAPVAVAPTVCLHLFAALSGTRLTEPLIATARQSCGRYEAGTTDEVTRLWSFDMREVIYVGDRAGARRFRDRALTDLTEVVRELGLPARIGSANDPFFTDSRADLASYQSTWDLKQEVCGRMAGSGAAVAVSSVNLHQQHFGQGFAMTEATGATASSACVGFGMDRWLHWIHGYLGDDPQQWPAILRRELPDAR